ncbi:MAG: hypothetical protein AMXMBFR33_44800 [Candidatus Xenobia bacterium]
MQITPRTVSQAFLQNEARLLQLKESPREADSLAELSSDTLARALEPLPADWRESARQLGLQALSQGLLCGALDGAILYQAGQLEPLAENRTGDEGKLLRSLSQAREVADQSWRGMGADDLQLLSGYGKHQNQATEAEAEQAAQGSADEFRTFLLATFKAGYAVGLVDAAVVFVAGETPGQPPA